MVAKESFPAVFDALKAVLEEYAGRLAIQVDKPGKYYLETQTPIGGRRLQFGGVKIGKVYVRFHLMPTYVNPKLQATISPELKKRKQGKSCFNFTHIEPDKIAELRTLAKTAVEQFKAWGQKAGSA